MKNNLTKQLTDTVRSITESCKRCSGDGEVYLTIDPPVLSSCPECKGRGWKRNKKSWIEKQDPDKYDFTYIEPLQLREILLALSKVDDIVWTFGKKGILRISGRNNKYIYDSVLQFPLNTTPSNYPDDLKEKLIELLK